MPGQPFGIFVEGQTPGLLNLGEGDILYLDLFSNTVYMGSDEFGMPVPAFKTSAGSYHLSGCLEIAPEAFLQ